MKFATKAIREGQQPDPTTGAVIVPIYQTANFAFKGVGKPNLFEYSRSGNPTRSAFEKCLASLEEAKYGLAFSSGMAAVDAAISILRHGDHVISSENIYGGTFRLFENVAVPRGIRFTYVDGTRPEAFAEAICKETKLVWIETPANPLLQLVDVKAVSEITRKHKLILVADNTFPSPCFQRPLTQGADVVVHSTTKYISGHSDVIEGAIVTNNEQIYTNYVFYQNAVGAVPGPFDCWLSLRGLKTLAVRMKKHEENALKVAQWLSSHPKAANVIYPGLESHPQHMLAKSQMDGFGAIVTFQLRGGMKAVEKFVDGLEIFLFAESLGGVESLVCHPWSMSHGAMSREEKGKIKITDGTIRLSIGIEDVDDLIGDIDKTLIGVDI
ncbi:MAG: PLP-dependent aspartate aminotransferase family protein [Phycisphaerae bacterium]|nr:PLP-dependent aspartate aminotransferase family protein [Phycisphaerae bacterium]